MYTSYSEVREYTPELKEEHLATADRIVVIFIELGKADAVSETPAWRMAMDKMYEDDPKLRLVGCDMLLRLLNIEPARVNRLAREVWSES